MSEDVFVWKAILGSVFFSYLGPLNSSLLLFRRPSLKTKMAAINLILVLGFCEFHSCILYPRLVCYRGFISVRICIINLLLGQYLLFGQSSGLFFLLLIGLLLSFRNLLCMGPFISGHCFPI